MQTGRACRGGGKLMSAVEGFGKGVGAGVQGHIYTLAVNVIHSTIFFLRAYCVLDFLQGSSICIIQCRHCLFFLPVFLGL